MATRVTVFDPTTGKRKAVDQGPSSFAVSSDEMKQGVKSWVLETPTDNYQTRFMAGPNANAGPMGAQSRDTQAAYDAGQSVKPVTDKYTAENMAAYNKAHPSSSTPPGSGVSAPPGGTPTPPAPPAATMGVGGFTGEMQKMLQHYQSLGPMQDRKRLLLKQLYDQPLTPEELRTLSPSQQKAIRDSDKSLVEYEILTINDQIKGRNTEYGDAIKYAMEGYKEEQAALDKKLEAAQNNILKYGSKLGLTPEELEQYMNTGVITSEMALKMSKGMQANGGLTEVSPGATLYDPETGEAVYTAPGGSASNTPASYDEWTLAGSPGTYVEWLKSKSGKAPTADQSKNAGFALRMKDSGETMERLYEKNPAVGGGFWNRAIPDNIWTNWTKSPEYQQLVQAERDFVNAVLRRESGAAISPSEFESAQKQYFPVPGDSKETITQKKHNRETALQGVVLGAGPALSEDFMTKGGAPSSEEDPLGILGK